MGSDAVAPEAPVAAPRNPAPQADNFVLGSAAQVPGKKKFSGKKLIAPAAILSVLAVAVVAVVLNFGAISDFFSSLFNPGGNNGDDEGSANLSGEEHLQKVEKDSVGGIADTLSQIYGTLLGQSNSGSAGGNGVELEFSLRIGDQVLDMMNATDPNGNPMDMSWLSEIGIVMDADSLKDLQRLNVGLRLSDQQLLTLSLFMNVSDGMLWLGVPEVSDDFLEVALEDLGLDMSTYEASLAEQEEILKILPSEETFNKLLNKYIDIALSQLDDVDKETDTLELDGLSQECTVLTLRIYQEDLLNIMKAVLEEAKDDEDLKTIIENYSDYYNRTMQEQMQIYDDLYVMENVDFYSQFQMAIEDALENLDSQMDDLDTETHFEITSYVDDADQVIGRRLELVSSDDDLNLDMHYMTVTEDNTFAFEAVVSQVEIIGSGTIKGNVVDGEYTVSVEGTEYLVLEVEDYDKAKLAEGYLCGTWRLEPTAELMDAYMGDIDMAAFADIALELKINTAANSADFEINILANDALLAGISLNTRTTDGDKIEAPSNNTVDITDQDEFMDWAESVDFDTLLNNLENAGVPDEILEAAEEALDSFWSGFLQGLTGSSGNVGIDEF